ncbi:MAG TPA: aldo/keto reductase [Caldilineaceae bacterium]|nr:aldo/keto reductase [Caldilineaceae bacterium]
MKLDGMAMEKTTGLATAPLGKSGITVPIMGFGSAPVAGLYRPLDDDAAIETIRFALAQGIFLFDTAPLYGAGRAEALIGRAMEGVPRDHYLISTKVGRLLDPAHGSLTFDFSRDGVLRSLEGSLQRLKTDRVDILHIHDPDNHQEQALAEAFPTLVELRSQGVVRAIGAGMNQWEALAKFAHFGDFDCFLLAGRYTLLEQGALRFLDLCREKGIGILLGGVFNSGILATGAVPGARHNYREAHQDILTRVAAIEEICERHWVQLNAAALQFAKAHPAVSSLVIGAASPDEIRANLEALAAPIPAAFWAELRAQGMLDPAAPLPST